MDAETLQSAHTLAQALSSTVSGAKGQEYIGLQQGPHALELYVRSPSDRRPWLLRGRPLQDQLRKWLRLDLRRTQGLDALYSRTFGAGRRVAAPFDERVFACTNLDAPTLKKLFEAEPVRQAAVALVDDGFTVSAFDSFVDLEASSSALPTAEQVKEAAARLAVLLDALCLPLPGLREEPEERTVGSYAMVVWMFSAGIWPMVFRTLDWAPWLVATALFFALMPPLKALVDFATRGTDVSTLTFRESRVLWVLARMVQAGPLVSVLVFGLNGLLDPTPRRDVSARIISGGLLNVEVESWRPGESSVFIWSGSNWASFKPGLVAPLRLGHGRWGFDYVLVMGFDLDSPSAPGEPAGQRGR